VEEHTPTDSQTPWFDNSLRSLITSNLITIVVAVVEGWSLTTLLFIYWAQSVIIGVFHIRRMLELESFTTDGLTMNGRPVAPIPSSKRQVAGFFALHYGFFHFVYLVFVLTGISTNGGLSTPVWWGLVGGVVMFAFNHYFSYRQNRALDRQGSPNLGTMLFLPYARVVPMHLMAGVGVAVGGTTRVAVIGFLSLKTIADAVMHIVEHRALRKRPATS